MDGRGRLSELDDRLLDERERGIRNRAYLATYKIMTGCLFAAVLILSFVRSLALGQDRVLGILLGFGFLAILLPRTIIAWRELPLDLDDSD